MELDIGSHCQYAYCNNLDFLPFFCTSCSRFFCLEHRLPRTHECSSSASETRTTLMLCPECRNCVPVALEADSASYADTLKNHKNSEACKIAQSDKKRCGFNGGCSGILSTSTAQVFCLCPDCSKYYCISHRHPEDHMCITISQPSSASKQRPSVLMKKDTTKNFYQQIFFKNENVRNTTLKVEKMRIRMKATGDKLIPIGNRFCFMIDIDEAATGPRQFSGGSPPYYEWIDKHKSVGVALNSLCKKLKIVNPIDSSYLLGSSSSADNPVRLILWKGDLKKVPTDVFADNSQRSMMAYKYMWTPLPSSSIVMDVLNENNILVISNLSFLDRIRSADRR